MSDERVPTEPGWWWRESYRGVEPVTVWSFNDKLFPKLLGQLSHHDDDGRAARVRDDGRWRGRCYTREDVGAAVVAVRTECERAYHKAMVEQIDAMSGIVDSLRAQLATVTRERDDARRCYCRQWAETWNAESDDAGMCTKHDVATSLYGPAEADRLFLQTEEPSDV